MQRIRIRTRPKQPHKPASLDSAHPVRPPDALLSSITATAPYGGRHGKQLDASYRSRRLGRQDVGRVGGKNASLGEMTAHLASAGVRVPPGFATTADAYGSCWTDTGCERGSRIRSRVCTRVPLSTR